MTTLNLPLAQVQALLLVFLRIGSILFLSLIHI